MINSYEPGKLHILARDSLEPIIVVFVSCEETERYEKTVVCIHFLHGKTIDEYTCMDHELPRILQRFEDESNRDA